jgi:glycosyltransferase involved in cell wall biosynthesis
MKIAVNTRFLIKDKLEGIGWFTYESLKRIVHKHPEHTFYFIFDRPFDSSFVFAKNVIPVVTGLPARHPFLWYVWFQVSLKKALRKLQPDLFLSTDGYVPLGIDIPTLNVIHDLNFHHYPKSLPFLVRKYYQYYFPKFAEAASRLATVSNYSKQDISTIYNIKPDKIDVVYNGSNPIYTPILPSVKTDVRNEYTQGNPYFIFVGAFNPRKNLARLLQAFEQFKGKYDLPHRLVLVGEKMFKTKEMNQVLESMKFSEEVIFTGRKSPDDLKKLYGAAEALCFVPYFEGFGIPLIEAMNCGIPIMAANATSLPEIASEAALLVDPFDVNEMSEGLYKIATDQKLRDKLSLYGQFRKNVFSWEATADKLWASMEKTIQQA